MTSQQHEKIIAVLGLLLESGAGLYEKSNLSAFLQGETKWETLPFLEKNTLNGASLSDSIITPYQKIDHIRFTSGTTSNNPLVVPRSLSTDNSLFVTPGTSPAGLLCFLLPHHNITHARDASGGNYPVIFIDTADLQNSITLAAKVGIDHFLGPLPLLRKILPLLEEYSLCDSMRRVTLYGELLTKSDVELIHSLLPNAEIAVTYSATEFQGVAAHGVGADATENILTLTGRHYAEIIDEHGNSIEDVNTVGELVLTTLEPSSLPLVRYKTGDLAERVAPDTYRFHGRIAFDYLKVPNGVIYPDIVTEAISDIHPHLSTTFQLTHKKDTSPLELTLTVEYKDAAAEELSEDTLEELATTIEKRLQVHPQKTYHDHVVTGLYAPLTLRAKKQLFAPGVKQRKIISQ